MDTVYTEWSLVNQKSSVGYILSYFLSVGGELFDPFNRPIEDSKNFRGSNKPLSPYWRVCC